MDEINGNANCQPIEDTSEQYPDCEFPHSTPEKPKRKKLIIISIVIFTVVLAILLFGIISYNNKKNTEYGNNLNTITYKILDSAAEAETTGNLIVSVWYNAIYQINDESTDIYTTDNGVFFEDFNTALGNLFADDDFINKTEELRSSQAEITALMKQLKNPPEKYKEAYTVLQTYYENYITLSDMIISPTGSLESFSEDFNTADTETVNYYKKMQILID